ANSGDVRQETAIHLESSAKTTEEEADGGGGASQPENTLEENFEDDDDESDEEETGDSSMARSISNASMWTRKDIDTFKETIRAEGGDGILKVGHGEIATIRVPTHE